MKKIVDWLISMEELSGTLYDGASKQFAYDRQLSAFLSRLAEDEVQHHHIMENAAEHLRKTEDIKSHVNVDTALKEKIESPFRRNYEMLSTGSLTRESVIDCMIETEYSEWNHIFIYVINMLKKQNREFMHVATEMQHHIEEITKFVQSLTDAGRYLEKIRSLPEVWKRNILVVEDSGPVRTMLATLLEREGNVDTAENGREALKKVAGSHYDVIISDIEMPLMNGIDFCKEALAIDPDIRRRIIFCSGSDKDAHMKYIRDNSMRFLSKPMDISDIRNLVHEVLSKTSVIT